MGKEHGLMDDLADLVEGRRPGGAVPFLKFGFGRDTPNQKLLTVVRWLLEALLWPGSGAPSVASAVARAVEFFKAMKAAGHFAIGEACEVGTASHRQLWYAGLAGALWGAAMAEQKGVPGADELMGLVLGVWLVETGSFAACSYTDGDGFHMLTPGARNGTANKPAVVNSLGDKVMSGLIAGWPPGIKVGKGSYDVAIPLLNRAFKLSVNPHDLWGDKSMTDYGFRRWVEPHGDGFYSWFEDLLEVNDPLYGAGWINGERVLEYDKDAAIARGRALPAVGEVTPPNPW